MKNRTKDIPGYLYAIDGLRAVSVIMIFTFHLWQQSWIYYRIQLSPGKALFDFTTIQRYGYIAIDIFFVISGFCLFYPLARNMFGESDHKINWKDFYIKRAKKILPSYYLMLILLVIFPILSYTASYNPSNFHDVFKHFITHATFTHGITDKTQGSMISTAWTLAIEIPFYIIFPVLAFFFKRKPVISFLVISVLTECCRIYGITHFTAGVAFQANPLFYLDIFAWGMISAYFVVLLRNKAKNLDRLKLPMLMLSILSIIILYQFMRWMAKTNSPDFDASVMLRMIYRPLLGFGASLFLFSTCFTYRFWERGIWGNKLFIFISTISYNFFLWHQNINIALRKLNIPYTASTPPQSDRAAMDGFSLLTAALSLIIATLVTYLVEQPIYKYGFLGYLKNIKEMCKNQLSKLSSRISGK